MPRAQQISFASSDVKRSNRVVEYVGQRGPTGSERTPISPLVYFREPIKSKITRYLTAMCQCIGVNLYLGIVTTKWDLANPKLLSASLPRRPG